MSESISLRQKQSEFAYCVSLLIAEAYRNGYEITLGEAWRSPETALEYAKEGKGIKHSLHIQRLAIDLNIFKSGIFLTNKEDYKPLGEYWKSLNSNCYWGGDFDDSDHFSYSPDGGMTK